MGNRPPENAFANGAATVNSPRPNRPTRRPALFLLWLAVAALTASLVANAAIAQAPPPRRTTIAGVRVGFQGRFKTDRWTPVEVILSGGPESYTGHLELSVSDDEGAQYRIRTAGERVQTLPGRQTTALAYIKPGYGDGEIHVRFIADGRPRAEESFSPLTYFEREETLTKMEFGLQPAVKLILEVGDSRGALTHLAPNNSSGPNQTVVVPLESTDQLPPQWYGYDGVDTVVLCTNDQEAFGNFSAGSARCAALFEWVRQGGEVVMFVGSKADLVLGPGAPLAELAPARYAGMYELRQASALEVFAAATTPAPMEGSTLSVPRLAEVRGRIVAYEGASPTELPLVIRGPYGFGRVTLAAVDLDAAPILRWTGRPAFVDAVLGRGAADAASQGSYYQGAEFASLLATALDQFTDVRVVPFFFVALLVLGYILLIGPVDYFLVKSVLKRMELTWITFPAIVIIVSLAAYWFAYWIKGDKLRVNQVELVDFDASSGQVRGVFWSHVFSPRSDAYHFALAPAAPGGPRIDDPDVQLSWMGRETDLLGGAYMASPGSSYFGRPYEITPDLREIDGARISMWSTKSILGRWSGRSDPPLSTQLREVADQMLDGHITNDLSVQLGRARLLYDRWVYDLRNIDPGQTIDLASFAGPQSITTWFGAQTNVDYYSTQARDVSNLIQQMSFARALADAGGTDIGPNRYQSTCDLSPMLTTGRAVLIAQVDATQSTRLVRKNAAGESAPLGMPDDHRWTIYRILIPVAAESTPAN